jgi:serine/threonine protein phosphatase 1
MIYVTSDLHGISPASFRQMLRSADFGEEDFLYVLGDVIDRGEYGAELLLELTQMPNAQLLLGNHEALLLA